MSVLSDYLLSLSPDVYWAFEFSAFDQDSGSLGVDIFGTGLGPGTFTNAMWREGKYPGDDAVYNPGPGTYIIGNTDASLANNGHFTLVLSNVYVATQTRLYLAHGLGSDDQIQINAAVGSPVVVTVAQVGGTLFTSAIDTDDLHAGWHDIVASWDGTHLRLWVDGEFVAVSAFTSGSRGTETDGFFEVFLSGTDITEGVAYFTRALTDQEIVDLHDAATSAVSHYVGGLRARLIRESVYQTILEALTDLGWFDAGRRHLPVTFAPTEVDLTTNITVNTLALADWDTTETDDEMGSQLSEMRHTYYLDWFPENDALGIHMAQDLKDILSGRMTSIGRDRPNIAVYDYQQATPPLLFHVDVENVIIDRPTTFDRPFMRLWRSIRFEIVDHYGRDDDAD